MQPELVELLRWLAMQHTTLMDFWCSLAAWRHGVQRPFHGRESMLQTAAFAQAWVTLCGRVLADARAALRSPAETSHTLWKVHQACSAYKLSRWCECAWATLLQLHIAHAATTHCACMHVHFISMPQLQYAHAHCS